MIKRLTEADEYGNYDIIKCPSENFVGDLNFNELNAVTEALNKLGKYENTNLSPAEIENLKAELDKKDCDFCEYKRGSVALVKDVHTEEYAKLQAENKELNMSEIGMADRLRILNTELEKTKTTLFLTVRNRIMEQQFEKIVRTTDVNVIAVRTIQKMEEMIDYPNATKTRIKAEKALKERK